MSLLDRDAILARCKRPTVVVDMFGGQVRMRALNGAEMDHLVKLGVNNGKPNKMMMAWIARMSIVDHEGQEVFRDEDVPMLAYQKKDDMQRLIDTFNELNAVTEPEQEKLAGNSKATWRSSSGSSSPGRSEQRSKSSKRG